MWDLGGKKSCRVWRLERNCQGNGSLATSACANKNHFLIVLLVAMAVVSNLPFSDLKCLSTVCDGIDGIPLIKVPHKVPLSVTYEGTAFLMELADLKLFRNYKLEKCEWTRNGTALTFTRCFKCNQLCGQIPSSQGRSSVFCQQCLLHF